MFRRNNSLMPSSLVPRTFSLLALGAAGMYYYDPKNGQVRRKRASRYLDQAMRRFGEDWTEAKRELLEIVDSSEIGSANDQTKSGTGHDEEDKASLGLVQQKIQHSSALPRVATQCVVGYAGLKMVPKLSFNALTLALAGGSLLLPNTKQSRERAENLSQS